MAWKRTVILWVGGSRVKARVASALRASVGSVVVRRVEVERESGRSGPAPGSSASGSGEGEEGASGEEVLDEEGPCGEEDGLGPRLGRSWDSERSVERLRWGWEVDIL